MPLNRMGVQNAGRYLGQTLRLMVGVPDYDTYVDHMRQRHPLMPVMSRPEFLLNRQEARFGGKGGGRCC